MACRVRGCLAFVRAAKTWALADGRGYVVPDDIKELAVPVLSHRLLLDAEAEFSGVTVEDVIGQLLSQVRPPTSRGARCRRSARRSHGRRTVAITPAGSERCAGAARPRAVSSPG